MSNTKYYFTRLSVAACWVLRSQSSKFPNWQSSRICLLLDMKTIKFYESPSGKIPVEEYLDTLTDNQVAKITWVLKLVREMDMVPPKYFKKLVNTDGIWEVRIDVGRNTFRILGFLQNQNLVILTNSFQKKSQKTPSKEISLAEQRKKEYLSRRH